MSALVEIQNVSNTTEIPLPQQIRQWVEAALQPDRQDAEVCIRIVDAAESQALNDTYRSKTYPTNVLSFPADLPEELGLPLLGDIAICATIVEQEASEQHKSVTAHWAHMVVHGILHLQGYDHIDDAEAEEMEALETKILTDLNFPPPYELLATNKLDANNLKTSHLETSTLDKNSLDKNNIEKKNGGDP